ncbi:hypothetical protein VNO77_43608 [Canavalia gladiata]|uniref:Uncharacterized protein n=1 Tax=Canavalia gladiata TaxID=3824 RepID=A0AAN9JWQ9_CANGL
MAWCSSSAKDAEEEKNTTVPNWLEVPRDVTSKILKNLGAIHILMSARYVCPLWWNICKEPFMWRTIHISNLDALSYPRTYEIENMCCHAVDLSRGQLQDFKSDYIRFYPLLKYIANSKNQLRRLGLVNCWLISDKALIEVANKFPLLEELEISYTSVSHLSLEAIGQNVRYLLTLKFNKGAYRSFNIPFKLDAEAFAIGKTMQKLRHLELVGNNLTNDGLLAILEGCTQLESLNLRACFNVYLGGSLGKRCRVQIKDLSLPYDHIPENLYQDDEDDDDDYVDVERWRSKTYTFHILPREMTSSLQDIRVLTGISPPKRELVGGLVKMS